MSFEKLVTICVTMGLRPEHLVRTFESLPADIRALPTVAVNDFGDEETNSAFRSVQPHGIIADHKPRQGQHAAIDSAYVNVRTPFVLHIEDDWSFDGTSEFLADAIAILSGSDAVSQVVLRNIDDLRLKPEAREKLQPENSGGQDYLRLDKTHRVWFRWTFNPHLSRLKTWATIGGFSQFMHERPVSRFFREQGQHSAFLPNGPCRHDGWASSTRLGHVAAPARTDA